MLIDQLKDAFGSLPPPSEALVFSDSVEREYYSAWSLPKWHDLTRNQASAYQYMSAQGRLYYLPGMLKLFCENLLEDVACELVLEDLTDPDYSAEPGRYELWSGVTSWNLDQSCAVKKVMIGLEDYVGHSLDTSLRYLDFRRRRQAYWMGIDCD